MEVPSLDGWEFYQVVFRKKIYETIEQLKIDLDQWIDYYNNERSFRANSVKAGRPCRPCWTAKLSERKSL